MNRIKKYFQRRELAYRANLEWRCSVESALVLAFVSNRNESSIQKADRTICQTKQNLRSSELHLRYVFLSTGIKDPILQQEIQQRKEDVRQALLLRKVLCILSDMKQSLEPLSTPQE